MKTISRLLQHYRTIHELTQTQVVEELQKYSERFESLTIVTLSRWETETTRPGVKKKQALLKFLFSKGCFNDPTCRAMIRERYASLQEGLEKSFDRQFKHLIGNFPESDTFEYSMSPLKEHPDREFYYNLIVQIEQASNPEGCLYRATPQILAEWCEHPASFAILLESHGQHAGHYIFLKLKNSVTEDIVHHRRSLFSITVNDFCDAGTKGTYLILTLFARSGKVAALLNIEHYYHLIDHMNAIDNIAIFSRREDTVPMTRDYGIHLMTSGIDEDEGYQWYGLSAPLEDILFTDTVVEAIY